MKDEPKSSVDAGGLITLFCVLVLLSCAVIYTSAEEILSIFYLVPVFLIVLALKLAWGRKSHIFSFVVVFLVTAGSLVSYGLLSKQGDERQLYLINTMTNSTDNSERQFNIFFTETKQSRALLSYRDMCAIESAALHNPDAQVIVYTMNATALLFHPAFNGTRGPELLEAYPNIKVKRLVPEELFASTPLMSWWKRGNVTSSPYVLAHMSDAARVALLWKYGGLYSDLDTVTLRSLAPIVQFSGVGHNYEATGDSVGNGVMSFERAHPFLQELMISYDKEYDPKSWAKSGPLLVARQLKSYCKTEQLYKSQLVDAVTFERLVAEAQRQREQPKKSVPKWESFGYTNNATAFNKCDVIIYPNTFFYPFNFAADSIYKSSGTIAIAMLINTYSVHTYGHLSVNVSVKLGQNTIYEYLAKSNCPVVFSSVRNQNVSFEMGY